MGRIYDGRAMLAPNGVVGHDGCVRYEEGACLLEARVGHTQVQLYKRDWAVDDGRAFVVRLWASSEELETSPI